MSTRRIPEYAGFVNPKALPKGPNGLPLCRWCKVRECRTSRNTFCSDECVHEHKIRTQPGYAKEQVAKRDDCRCAICGVDTFAGERARWEARQDLRPWSLMRLKCRTFDMDHIVPVVEGGGSCGLENLRTLCRPCHRAETAKLAARRAAARNRKASDPQAALFLPSSEAALQATPSAPGQDCTEAADIPPQHDHVATVRPEET